MRHAFISFSRSDIVDVREIARLLRDRHIPLWLDETNLKAGSPDWEQAIRDALDQSFAVVYMASPTSRRSNFVKGELTLAEKKSLRIFPVWLDGDSWEDAAPIGLLPTQYIDLRRNGFSAGLERLVTSLLEEMPKVQRVRLADTELPNTVELDELWIWETLHGGHRKRRAHEVPPNHTELDFSTLKPSAGKAGVWVKPSSIMSIGALLDRIFVNYLSKHFRPFTYGSDWVLRKASNAWPLLALPVRPLNQDGKQLIQPNDPWRRKSVSDAGLEMATCWEVQTIHDVAPFIVVCKDIVDQRTSGTDRTNLCQMLSARDRWQFVKFQSVKRNAHLARVADLRGFENELDQIPGNKEERTLVML